MPNMLRFLFFAVPELEQIAKTLKYLIIQDTHKLFGDKLSVDRLSFLRYSFAWPERNFP
jgi:hypothetical protein